jgi:exonuclease III
MIPSKNQPRTWRIGYKLGHGKRTVELKIATWNITSFFRIGSCQNLIDVIRTYGIKVAALQEIRRTGAGQLKVGEYVIFYSGLESSHFFGSGFAVHESLEPYVREFNPVSERIAVLRINTTPINMVLICVHAPTEVSTDNGKDAFYENLDRVYDKIPGNVIKVILGDLNAMCGKEIQFQLTIGKESLHYSSNDNWLRIISFASSKNMIISSTTYPHKKIH